jgi:hypothetical protein
VRHGRQQEEEEGRFAIIMMMMIMHHGGLVEADTIVKIPADTIYIAVSTTVRR